MKNDKFRQLKELGFSSETIYSIQENDDYRDYVDEADLGYYSSDRFYYEDGVAIRKGYAYTPSRFAA